MIKKRYNLPVAKISSPMKIADKNTWVQLWERLIFSPATDEDGERLGRLFNILMVISLGIVLAITLIFVLMFSLGMAKRFDFLISLSFPILFAILSLFTLWQSRRGKTQKMIRLYVWANLAGISLAVFVFDGARSPAWELYIWTITIAGTLIKPSYALQMMGWMSAYFVTLFSLQSLGIYAPLLTLTTSGREFAFIAFGFTMMISTVGLLTYLNMTSLQKAMRDLRSAKLKLQEYHVELERQVEERTRELVAERNLLRALVDNLPDVIFVKDLTGKYMLINHQGAQQLNLKSTAEAVGKTDSHFFTENVAQEHTGTDALIIKTGQSIIDQEIQMKTGSGDLHWFLYSKIPVREKNGELSRIVGIYRDIQTFKETTEELRRHRDELDKMVQARTAELTELNLRLKNEIAERKQIEQSLRQSEELYRRLVKTSPDVVILSDRHGKIFMSNEQALQLFGVDSQQKIIGTYVYDWLAVEDHARVRENIQQAIREGQAYNLEYDIFQPNGTKVPIEINCSAIQSDEEGISLMLTIRDVTRRKEAQEQLVFAALHDSLTGLPNRTLLFERLERAILHASHRKRPFAILFLDLDRFKLINDSYGHLAGDELLIKFARYLEKNVSASDTIARMGGDEFVIILDDLNASDDAILVARRILDLCQMPFSISGREIFISTSIGIVNHDFYQNRTAADFLMDADIALYKAKSEGKNRFAVFHPDLRSEPRALLELENEMQRALAGHEFELFYQPVVDLATGEPFGVEALLRWNHPMRGILSATEFISLAEETGLVIPIGEWVISEACKQLKIWSSAIPSYANLIMLINLSAGQLHHPDLVSFIKKTFYKYDILAARFRIEVTESVFIHDLDQVAHTLRALKDMGIDIGIDDFGTGYSSFSYLHHLPIQFIKLDRSFVHHIGSDERSNTIIRTLIKAASDLELTLIAEGIETEMQRAMLISEGCHYGQGFLYTPPLPVKKLEDYLKNGTKN